MFTQTLPIWKEAPFTRFLIPFISAIIAEWYGNIRISFIWTIFFTSLCTLILFAQSKFVLQFKYNWIKGSLLNSLLFCLGYFVTGFNDYSQHGSRQLYKKGDVVIANIEEPLIEKSKTLKAEASIQFIVRKDSLLLTKSHILIYLQKDSTTFLMNYGSQIVFTKPVQPIRNAGNPGAFDYQQYCSFQHIYGQVYLTKKDFIILPKKKENFFKKFLFILRKKIVNNLQTYIKGKKETGLAEALLIGYKNDLDKDLIQSYTNTGVVHIIAISGLHLALIYSLLQFSLKKVGGKKNSRWIKPIILITCLWSFSFLSGASPSVLRSAVMFSFIIIGKSFSKSGSIYNSLAASAFLLLCYNPFWIWDIGFQLSYCAVLSIVIFERVIYNWFFIKNKLLDIVWKSASVSLAAEILTGPISIYHFHQFPNYFLFSNLLAVPLSSLVLLGELFVCFIGFVPFIAKIAGAIVSWMIMLLNGIIEYIEKLPFSIWDHLHISLFQLLFIYMAIVSFSVWLLQKNKTQLWITLFALMCFAIPRALSFINTNHQSAIVVYNVPHHEAIDFIRGRVCIFKGDDAIEKNDSIQNIYFRPARIQYRINQVFKSRLVDSSNNSCTIFQVKNKRVVVIDRSIFFKETWQKITVDLIIIAKSPQIDIHNLSSVFNCKQWIFDASNSISKINAWKRECSQLGLSSFNVADKGAFTLSID